MQNGNFVGSKHARHVLCNPLFTTSHKFNNDGERRVGWNGGPYGNTFYLQRWFSNARGINRCPWGISSLGMKRLENGKVRFVLELYFAKVRFHVISLFLWRNVSYHGHVRSERGNDSFFRRGSFEVKRGMLFA